MQQDINKIEHKIGKLPEAYREWINNNVTTNEAYSFYSLDWIPLNEILSVLKSSEDEFLPGILPIGILFDVDLWCLDLKNKDRVIICPHDDIVADLYAPSVEGWLYRICLEEASSFADENEIVINQLTLWSKLLMPSKPEWGKHIQKLSKSKVKMFGDFAGVISKHDVNSIIKNEFGVSYLSENVEYLASE